MTEALILSEAELESLPITTAAAVAAIEDAVRADIEGRLWVAPKASVLTGDGRYMMTTLAVADTPGLTVVKSLTVNARNGDHGLDRIEGNIFAQDSETGLLRAVMGAKWVTRVRTAGLSAVAATRLANPDARVLACIGCGVQARGHLQAFADLFPLAEVRAFGRGQANIDRLCTLARDLGLAAVPCDSARVALEGADLVVSSVTLTEPVDPFLDARWLKPGAFAAITDLARPWIADGMAALGAAFIDDHRQEAALGKPMIDPALVTGDLRDLVAGPPSRFDPDQRSAFVFRGLAVGDFALTGLAYEKAVEAGLGTPFAV